MTLTLGPGAFDESWETCCSTVMIFNRKTINITFHLFRGDLAEISSNICGNKATRSSAVVEKFDSIQTSLSSFITRVMVLPAKRLNQYTVFFRYVSNMLHHKHTLSYINIKICIRVCLPGTFFSTNMFPETGNFCSSHLVNSSNNPVAPEYFITSSDHCRVSVALFLEKMTSFWNGLYK